MTDLAKIDSLFRGAREGSNSSIESSLRSIEELLKRDDSISILINLFEYTNDEANKRAILVNLRKLIKQRWSSLPSEEKAFVISKLRSYIQVNYPLDTAKLLASAIAVVIKRESSWAEFQDLISNGSTQFTLFLIDACLTKIPEDFIKSNHISFLQLALAGLMDQSDNSYTVFSHSVRILCELLPHITDPTLVAPAVNLALSLIPNFTIPEAQFNAVWILTGELMEHSFIPMTSLPSILEIPVANEESNPQRAFFAIRAFADLAQKLNSTLLETILSASFQVSVVSIAQDSALPPDALDIPSFAVQNGTFAPMVRDMALQFLSGDIYHQALGIYLLGILLPSPLGIMRADLSDCQKFLVDAIKGTEPILRSAALDTIAKLEDSSSEVASIALPLTKETLPLLTNEDITTRSQAYNALSTLCDLFDSNVEGLFESVWSLQPSIQEEELPEYFSLVGKILKLSSDIDDETIDGMYGWVDTIFDKANSINVRSSALYVVSSLMVNQESMIADILPIVNDTICEGLSDTSDDVICASADFLKVISIQFKAESTEFISQFAQSIQSIIEKESSHTRILSSSLLTASIMIGYSNDKRLLNITAQKSFSLLQSSECEQQKDGCDCVSFFSKALSLAEDGTQLIKLIFDQIISIIEKSVEPGEADLFESALKALRKILKKSPEFVSASIELISKFFSGDLPFLTGEPAQTNKACLSVIQPMMELVGTVFQSNPPNADDLCSPLIEWLRVASEEEAFSLTGALSDAIEFSSVARNTPLKILDILTAIGNSITDPDLQHNVAYFLGVILRKFPELKEEVAKMVGFVIDWWNIGLSKDSGFKEMLSNIALFFLTYVCEGGELENNIIVGTLRQFPPADLKDTADMSEMILKLAAINDEFEVKECIAVGIAKLFAEPMAKSSKRELTESLSSRLKAMLKSLCGNHEIEAKVIQPYLRNKSKKAIIENIIA